MEQQYEKGLLFPVILIFLFALSTSPGDLLAEVSLTDDPSFGPGSIIRDLDNGLDWLRLEETAAYSYNSTVKELFKGGRFEGWRVASKRDLLQLGKSANVSHSSRDLTVRKSAAQLRDWLCNSCAKGTGNYKTIKGAISDIMTTATGSGGHRLFSIGTRNTKVPEGWVETSVFMTSGYVTSADDTSHRIFLVRSTPPPNISIKAPKRKLYRRKTKPPLEIPPRR